MKKLKNFWSDGFISSSITMTTLNIFEHLDNISLIQIAIDSGIDINAVDRNGDTLLHLAIKYGYFDVASLLLNKNANVEITNNMNQNVFHVALLQPQRKYVDMLLIKHAGFDGSEYSAAKMILLLKPKTNFGETKGFFAVIQKINNLLPQYSITNEYPCSPMTSSTGFTGFMFLFIMLDGKKDVEYLKAYIKNNREDINTKNAKGWTVFHIVCRNARKYDIEVIKCMLDNGANIHTCEKDGWNALMMAAFQANNESTVEVVRLLLTYGANVNIFNREGWNVLMLACVHSGADSHHDVVELLLNHGAYVDARSSDGWTALMVTARYSTSGTEAMSLLLNHGANVDLQRPTGWTALMMAARYSNTDSHIDRVKLLLDHGANVNLVEKNGWSAIMMACRHHNTHSSVETVKALMNHGADTHLVNKDGYDCLKLVQFETGNHDAVEMLLKQ